jgi:hypothetical protein
MTAPQNFSVNLKKHLLARIKAMQTDPNPVSHAPGGSRVEGDSSVELNHVIFKNDRLYKHNVMTINYTTYDVRRANDVINPNTDHSDIMLLSSDDDDHQYSYARVLGIYHANVIYPPQDCQARRMEFLWVRWFTNVRGESVQSSWARRQLDHLQFLPVNQEKAFGFVDPVNVLRGVHVIPRFARGMRHKDGMRGLSKCAKDTNDYHQYCVGR